VVHFLEEALSQRAMTTYPQKNCKNVPKANIMRKFWHIGELETNRQKKWDCDAIEGSRNLHSFSSISIGDSTKLMVRELSYFCVPCQMRDWEACKNLDHVPRWRCLRIQSKPNSWDVRAQMVREHDGEDS
jgi:hypothetical protein